MLEEVFDGLVAAGTLALAGATFRLARGTGDAVREAYRARVDASAHRVLLRGARVWQENANARHVSNTDPGLFGHDVGKWNLAQHGDAHIGLPASVLVQNEGVVTALVGVDVPQGVEFWHAHDPVPKGGMSRLTDFEQQSDGSHLLPPGETAEMRFIWWQSANEWAAAAEARVSPTCTVTVTVRDVAGGALDTWEFTYGTHVLWRHPTEDGWIVAARDMRSVVADPPPLPVAVIGRPIRCYPGEPPPPRMSRRRLSKVAATDKAAISDSTGVTAIEAEQS